MREAEMGHQNLRAPWPDRTQAGQALATKLPHCRGRLWDTRVLGLPHGGLVVAAGLARELRLPLASWSVQRLGGDDGRTLVALAPGNIVAWDPTQADQRATDAEGLQLLQALETEMRRLQLCLADALPNDLRGQRLIVVDEGIRSGLTMAAALTSLRRLYPASITVAAPMADRHGRNRLANLADDLVVLQPVVAGGERKRWFREFTPPTDSELIALLAEATA
jgi:predicted phosphoribosyltransferase